MTEVATVAFMLQSLTFDSDRTSLLEVCETRTIVPVNVHSYAGIALCVLHRDIQVLVWLCGQLLHLCWNKQPRTYVFVDQNDLYTIKVQSGILKNKYSHNQFDLCPQQLLT